MIALLPFVAAQARAAAPASVVSQIAAANCPPRLEIRRPHRRRRALISPLPRAQIPPIRTRPGMSQTTSQSTDPSDAPLLRLLPGRHPRLRSRRLPRRLQRRLRFPRSRPIRRRRRWRTSPAAPVANNTTQAIEQVQVSGCLSHCQGASQTQVASQQNQTVQAVSGARTRHRCRRRSRRRRAAGSSRSRSAASAPASGARPRARRPVRTPRAVRADARARRGQRGASGAGQRSDPEHGVADLLAAADRIWRSGLAERRAPLNRT